MKYQLFWNEDKFTMEKETIEELEEIRKEFNEIKEGNFT